MYLFRFICNTIIEKIRICNSFHTFLLYMTYISLDWLPKNVKRLDDEIELLMKFFEWKFIFHEIIAKFCQFIIHTTYVIQNHQLGFLQHIIFDETCESSLVSWILFLMRWLLYIVKHFSHTLRNIKYRSHKKIKLSFELNAWKYLL